MSAHCVLSMVGKAVQTRSSDALSLSIGVLELSIQGSLIVSFKGSCILSLFWAVYLIFGPSSGMYDRVSEVIGRVLSQVALGSECSCADVDASACMY